MVYPLATRGAVKKPGFSGVTITSIQASNSLIAVLFLLDETTFIRIICNSQSISQSSLLRVLYSRTLNILHTTQSRQLSFFSRIVSIHTSEVFVETTYNARQDRLHPIIFKTNSLCRRLSRVFSITTTIIISIITLTTLGWDLGSVSRHLV